ncbi:MAG: DUF6526 family protein [Acidobacteria bacterium]|nr:DUF6526 family protein [Acidobacteriota bacterium]
MPQSYASHAHHPVPTYIAGVLWLLGLLSLLGWSWLGWQTFSAGIYLLLLSIAPLIASGRSYVTRLQDRIIQLEMKVRCAEVLPAGDDAKLRSLTPKQVVALRFASDEELGALLDRAVRERLSPGDIKQAVQHWRADELRA